MPFTLLHEFQRKMEHEEQGKQGQRPIKPGICMFMIPKNDQSLIITVHVITICQEQTNLSPTRRHSALSFAFALVLRVLRVAGF